MKRALWADTTNQAVEEQIKASEAWIEHTGDVTDPGELGMLVAALSCLQDGDEEAAAEIFLALATSLREGDEVGAKEAGAALEE